MAHQTTHKRKKRPPPLVVGSPLHKLNQQKSDKNSVISPTFSPLFEKTEEFVVDVVTSKPFWRTCLGIFVTIWAVFCFKLIYNELNDMYLNFISTQNDESVNVNIRNMLSSNEGEGQERVQTTKLISDSITNHEILMHSLGDINWAKLKEGSKDLSTDFIDLQGKTGKDASEKSLKYHSKMRELVTNLKELHLLNEKLRQLINKQKQLNTTKMLLVPEVQNRDSVNQDANKHGVKSDDDVAADTGTIVAKLDVKIKNLEQEINECRTNIKNKQEHINNLKQQIKKLGQEFESDKHILAIIKHINESPLNLNQMSRCVVNGDTICQLTLAFSLDKDEDKHTIIAHFNNSNSIRIEELNIFQLINDNKPENETPTKSCQVKLFAGVGVHICEPNKQDINDKITEERNTMTNPEDINEKPLRGNQNHNRHNLGRYLCEWKSNINDTDIESNKRSGSGCRNCQGVNLGLHELIKANKVQDTKSINEFCINIAMDKSEKDSTIGPCNIQMDVILKPSKEDSQHITCTTEVSKVSEEKTEQSHKHETETNQRTETQETETSQGSKTQETIANEGQNEGQQNEATPDQNREESGSHSIQLIAPIIATFVGLIFGFLTLVFKK